MPLSYSIYPAETATPLSSDPLAPEAMMADWRNPRWAEVEPIEIRHFHAASGSHRPIARAKLLYDERNLYLRFNVEDRYVVSTQMKYQEAVYRDSCVEFFVQPLQSGGYFNFEINCGGTLLLYYIEDPARVDGGFAKFTPVAIEHGRRVRITHSAPAIVHPETPEPLQWQIGCQIPLDVLEVYVGPLGSLAGQTWNANFFKCADDSSHPHWASWSPIGEELNFHQPRYFAPLRFAEMPAGLAERREALSISE